MIRLFDEFLLVCIAVTEYARHNGGSRDEDAKQVLHDRLQAMAEALVANDALISRMALEHDDGTGSRTPNTTAEQRAAWLEAFGEAKPGQMLVDATVVAALVRDVGHLVDLPPWLTAPSVYESATLTNQLLRENKMLRDRIAGRLFPGSDHARRTGELGAQCDGGRTPCSGPRPTEAFTIKRTPFRALRPEHACNDYDNHDTREHEHRLWCASHHRGAVCTADEVGS